MSYIPRSVSYGDTAVNITNYLGRSLVYHRHLIWLESRGKFGRRLSLRRQDLRYMDLTNLDLRGADLSFVDLRWSDLSGTDLRWTNLEGADLDGCRYLPSTRISNRWDEIPRWTSSK